MSGTNFAQYSHQQLSAMLYAGNPQTARSMAATWDDTGNSLHDQVNRLERQLTGFADSWQGGAADQYKTMVTDLIGGIRKVADTAYSMRNMAEDAAQAQDKARAMMPQPVDVPALPPAAVALAGAPIQVDANTPAAVVAQIQQARAAAIAAVQGQQAASVAADAAHAQAVLVMQMLAGDYQTAQASIPPAPDATTAAPIKPGTPGIVPDTAAPVSMPIPNPGAQPFTGDPANPPIPGTIDPTTGLPIAMPKQPQSPLFGDMFTAGVAAASAAVFGRFGSLIPKVPAFATKKDPTAGSASDGTTPQLGDRTAAGLSGTKLAGAGAGGAALGGLKGLGGGGGIGGLGGGMAAAAPSASPSMLGASGMTSELAAATGAAGGAAAGAGGMPMMPMMPMGGMMGGGDMGGARRIPPWLVETEDVWGESSSVSPTVIGED